MSEFTHPITHGCIAFPAMDPPLLELPFASCNVPAGFPSPADDFSAKRLDLNELLITHPAATFFWAVTGRSMIDAGIDEGDILVVNRALTARHGQIVVAEVNGEFTVKIFHSRAGIVKLVPANLTFPEIRFRDGETMSVCGVVTSVIKRFVT